MKPLNLEEIKLIASELNSHLGARLQDIVANDSCYGFELYHNGVTFWIWVDLDSQVPVLIKSDSVKIKSKMTPLVLFIRAHCKGKKLRKLYFDSNLGRILSLEWGSPTEYCNFEMRLFPHGQNLIISTPDKKISWQKVNELRENISKTNFSDVRSWAAVTGEWLASKKGASPTEKPNLLLKKIATLNKIKENLRTENYWQKIGLWLKENQTLEVPGEWLSHVDIKLNLAKNIQRAFEKAKQFEQKLLGTQNRIQILEREISTLREKPQDEELKNQSNLLFELKIKGKRIPFEDGIEGYMGNSAKDNMNLLRKAKAWDYWIHLKDYPSAHGFIRRNKNQVVPHSAIEKMAKIVAEKSKISKGEAFEVILAECRYVGPIKGDKLGRVTYKNEKNFTFRL